MSRQPRSEGCSVCLCSIGWSKSTNFNTFNQLQLQHTLESGWSSMESHGVNDSSPLHWTPRGLQRALELEVAQNRSLRRVAPPKRAHTDHRDVHYVHPFGLTGPNAPAKPQKEVLCSIAPSR